jgi:hypothetical protein
MFWEPHFFGSPPRKKQKHPNIHEEKIEAFRGEYLDHFILSFACPRKRFGINRRAGAALIVTGCWYLFLSSHSP